MGKRRTVAVLVAAALVLAGCVDVVPGRPSVGNAPNASLPVHGDSGDAFDTAVKNALSDVIGFWQEEYPKISGGRSLAPLKGGLYSVDGLRVAETGQVTGPAAREGCILKDQTFIVDNGAYCGIDDSIAWDRAPTHLFAQLADKYGPFMVAMIFAHEYGHAVSERLGILDQNRPTIDFESQADCAAGAWTAWALKGRAPHFRTITKQKVDDALEGFLTGRDATPDAPQDISHGNGFDRLSAVADGIDKGATYCYSDGYFASRTFTERAFRPDEQQSDNTPLADMLDTSAKNPFVEDLNRFWTNAAKSIKKTFRPVSIEQAAHPPCAGDGAGSAFGYCPGTNTVYFSNAFAHNAYYSLPGVQVDPDNGNVQLLTNQPADFALGVLFSIAWGMAVRHQLFGRSLADQAALMSAVCYTGSYAKNINVDPATHTDRDITLSPSDLDEATSSMLDQVDKPQAFGARGTTGLDRVQAFVKGYRDGLSAC